MREDGSLGRSPWGRQGLGCNLLECLEELEGLDPIKSVIDRMIEMIRSKLR